MSKTTFSMPLIFVQDIAISKKFYQDIFDFEIEFDFGENISFKDSISLWEIKHAENIIYDSTKENRFTKGIKPLELYFETEDIEFIYKLLKEKNVKMIHELKEESWGQRNVRFYDPDQFIIEVGEPMENVVLRLSKSGMTQEEVSKKTQMPSEVVGKIIRDKQQ